MDKEHPSESQHFYHRDGTPAYTVIGKNGKERPTTLRDARKENLVPGVTTIIRCASAFGLENWKIDQAILAALTMPRIDDESEADYIARIKKDAKEQAAKAAERGIQIHAAIQAGFEGKPVPPDLMKYYLSAKGTLDTECSSIQWICEKSFATERYGGKVDLQSDVYLVDIKTTDKDLSTIKTWDEQAMQLAAYDINADKECGILYIHVKTAESRLIWIPPEEIDRGWECFDALLDFYFAKTGLMEAA